MDMNKYQWDVIVVEGNHYAGQIICRCLQEFGLKFRLAVGIDMHLVRGPVMQYVPDPDIPMVQEFCSFAWIDAHTYLVGGKLGLDASDESGPHGWHLVPKIVEAGSVCIATSSSAESRKRMLDAGAHYATQHKYDAVAFMRDMQPIFEELGMLAHV